MINELTRLKNKPFNILIFIVIIFLIFPYLIGSFIESFNNMGVTKKGLIVWF